MSTIWLLYTTISTWENKGKLINSFGEDLRRFHERGGILSYVLKVEQIHERKHIQISLNRLRIKCLQWGATKDFRMRKFKKKDKKKMCLISLNIVLFSYALYLVNPMLDVFVGLFLLLFLLVLAHGTLFPCVVSNFMCLLIYLLL